jgi:hypothetical protein
MLQAFDLAAMYEDLATLEVKLNQLLESMGKPVMKAPACKSVVPAEAAAASGKA